MKVLLDTNVVSEWASPQPSPHVREWLNEQDDDGTFLSAVTLAELRRGILLLPPGKRRARLATWFGDELLRRFDGRCLPVREEEAFEWARLSAQASKSGIALDAMDGFIAATASVHGLVLATRNTRHFESCGIHLVDPWSP